MIKKIIFALLFLMMVLSISACSKQVSEVDQDLAKAMASLDESVINELKAKANLEGIAFTASQYKLREATELSIFGALKNDYEEDSTFSLTHKCYNLNGNVVSIITERDINVKSGEVKVFELLVRPRNTAVGFYKCDIEVNSESQEYTKTIEITIE